MITLIGAIQLFCNNVVIYSVNNTTYIGIQYSNRKLRVFNFNNDYQHVVLTFMNPCIVIWLWIQPTSCNYIG